MPHSYEGTTLALQHYYDIIGAPRTLPLMTLYPANEQPFGHRMSIWMAAYNDDIALPDSTRRRLDDAMLKNRAITDPHVLRVLDYGTSEGNSFVVTDAINSITLRAWIRTHGPLQTWQSLRLLEQLTGIVTNAHQHGFSNLCLTSDNIFIVDEDRFEIKTGPLGIGLHRAEILKMRDITISTEMMRHIPPWEYVSAFKQSTRKQVEDKTPPNELIKKAENEDSSALLSVSGQSDLFELTKPSEAITPENQPNTDENADTPAPTPDNTNDESLASDADPKVDENEDLSKELRDDSIQEIDFLSASIESEIDLPATPENLCPDVYALTAILYESLCGHHPYFSDSNELCAAALSIAQGNPPELGLRVVIDDNISNLVMSSLRDPKADSAPQLLANFAALCSADDREKSRQAEKCWLTPTQSSAPAHRQRHIAQQIKHPYLLAGAAVALVLAIVIALTWQAARHLNPVDLFALPEILPMEEQDGVDVIIAPRTNAPNTTLYLTSLADGKLIPLGPMPYVHKHQKSGAKISFVIADDTGNTMQLPVIVKGDQGIMFIPVELNW